MSFVVLSPLDDAFGAGGLLADCLKQHLSQSEKTIHLSIPILAGYGQFVDEKL